MGYFSNGSEGCDYLERFCFRCNYWQDEVGCPIWSLHEDRNYEDCNNEDSVLHKLIPMTESRGNGECIGFSDSGMRKGFSLAAEKKRLDDWNNTRLISVSGSGRKDEDENE